jgi:hypothetical protein
MDEYSALAQRVVLTMDDVQGCLVLSRDGLVLGAYPDEEESAVKVAWLRFVHVGDARRSFVEFGDQTWAYVHRGPYAAFVVSGLAVRAGVLLDQLEQGLMVAEQSRAKRDATRIPEAPAAPTGRPRTNLHPPDRTPAAETASAEAWSAPAEMSAPPAAPPAEMSAPPAAPPVAPPAGGPIEVPPAQPSRPTTSFRRPEPAGEAEPPSTSLPPGGSPDLAAARPHVAAQPEEASAASQPGIDLESLYAEFADLEAADAAEESSASEPAAGSLAPTEATVDAAPDVTAAAPADAAPPGSPSPEDPSEPLLPTMARPARPMVPEDEVEEPTPEVDRVLLAKEFSGLLQLDADDDEARS